MWGNIEYYLINIYRDWYWKKADDGFGRDLTVGQHAAACQCSTTTLHVVAHQVASCSTTTRTSTTATCRRRWQPTTRVYEASLPDVTSCHRLGTARWRFSRAAVDSSGVLPNSRIMGKVLPHLFWIGSINITISLVTLINNKLYQWAFKTIAGGFVLGIIICITWRGTDIFAVKLLTHLTGGNY